MPVKISWDLAGCFIKMKMSRILGFLVKNSTYIYMADIEVDKVADIEVNMVADMEMDMVADIDIDIAIVRELVMGVG